VAETTYILVRDAMTEPGEHVNRQDFDFEAFVEEHGETTLVWECDAFLDKFDVVIDSESKVTLGNLLDHFNTKGWVWFADDIADLLIIKQDFSS